MTLSILKPSILTKNKGVFNYSNPDFDKILRIMLNKLEYDYIVLLIWTLELKLFNNIEYELLSKNNRFSTIKIVKPNSIMILEPDIYENIRLFEIEIFTGNKKLFNIFSDNYGEYTSITMDKIISEDKALEMLEYIIEEI